MKDVYQFQQREYSRTAKRVVNKVAQISTGCLRSMVAAVLVTAACAVPVHALFPATLTDPTLQTQPVRAASLSGGVLRFVGADRNFQELSTRGVIRLRFERELLKVSENKAIANSPGPHWVRLTDGQVLFGEVIAAEDNGEVLRWRHPELGVFSVSLDHVAGFDSAAPLSGTSGSQGVGDDSVTLYNGDVIRGFVVAVEKQGLVLDTGEGGEVVLPWENLRTAAMANPSVLPVGQVDTVTLADGSVIRSEPVTFDETAVQLSPQLSDSPTPTQRVPIEQVVMIDFGASGFRLLDLASQPMRVVKAGEAFGLRYEPYVADGEIRLHGPAEVVFELPSDARRFSTRVGLALPARTPMPARRLAEVPLWIEDDGTTEPTRITLNADAPTRRINIPVSSKSLKLRLGEASYGPVLNRLTLQHAWVLVAVLPEPASETR